MSSFRIIFSCVVILVCVALFAGYAQIEYEGAAYDEVPKVEVEAERGGVIGAWDDVCRWFWGGSIGKLINPEDGKGLGFVLELAFFNVPGLPMVFSWVFWFVTMALIVAVGRLVLGMVLGGGG